MSNEINRITKQFTHLQHGDCWVGINFKEALHGVDAQMASAKINAEGNSIWMLTAHIIYWRNMVINRLTGSSNPPPFPDFLLPEELTDANWRQTLHDFESVYHLLRSTIHNLKEENLDKISPHPDQSFYELIVGCLQHDAYHLGQIVLIKKS